MYFPEIHGPGGFLVLSAKRVREIQLWHKKDVTLLYLSKGKAGNEEKNRDRKQTCV